ncbi:hypothetical protein ACIGXI_35500 [Kitasatospora aureofaciens]
MATIPQIATTGPEGKNGTAAALPLYFELKNTKPRPGPGLAVHRRPVAR